MLDVHLLGVGGAMADRKIVHELITLIVCFVARQF